MAFRMRSASACPASWRTSSSANGIIEAMDAAKDIYHDGCLAGIDLVGNIRLLAKLRWDEYHAMGLQYIIERILRWKRVCQLCLQLMRAWHRL